jgi:sarcosine oxidase, subunit gamma
MAMTSPLAMFLDGQPRTLQVDAGSAVLSEIPFVQMLNLRGDAADARFVDAVLRATGLPLPLAANRAERGDMRQLLWLGPDEWLFQARDGQGDAVAADLRAALQGLHHAVVEVGDGHTVLRVEGPGAGELLMRGCPLDLHPRHFTPGCVAQSHVARANMTLLCLEAGTCFELTVRRAFADYLARWLCAAALG